MYLEVLWDLLHLRRIPAQIIGLLTGLCSCTESTLKCGGVMSSFFPLNTGMQQGYVPAPLLFNTTMDLILGRVVDQSNCGALVGNTKITDFVLSDNAVIFAASLEALLMTFEALHKEGKNFALQVSLPKTKVHVFGGLLNETLWYSNVSGEYVDILEGFTYLASVVYTNGVSRQEVLQRIGLTHDVMDSLSTSIWHSQYLCRRIKIWIFKS